MIKIPDHAAYKLLEKYKIPVAKYKFIKYSRNFAEDAEEAVTDFPCVVKIDGDIIHKKKAGCVEIIYKKEETKGKIKRVVRNSRKFNVYGMIVQEFISGKEAMIGAKRDPRFGTIVMFGAGGILADIIKDVSFRAIPATDEEIVLMVKETKAYQAFMEFDERMLDQTASAIAKIIRLMEANPDIAELDINPFFICTNNYHGFHNSQNKCVSGDVRILRR